MDYFRNDASECLCEELSEERGRKIDVCCEILK